MRMRHIVICGLPRSAIFFSRYLIKGTILEKKKLLNTNCVFSFSLQLLSQTFLILRSTQHDMIKKMCFGLHVKCPLFLPEFNKILIF